MIITFLKENQTDRFKTDQLKRCSMSIVLNIAEGNARFGPKDRKHFFSVARGSAMETKALFDLFEDEQILTKQEADLFRIRIIEVVKILTKMIMNLNEKI